MRVKIISVGTRVPTWIDSGIAEFTKRLAHDMPIEWVEIQAPKRSNTNSLQARAEEGKLIAKVLPTNAYVVALEVKGQTFSSEGLADFLVQRQREGQDLMFIIGGAEGIEPSISQRANLQWSLSSLTLPHMLVRVVLAEALYRAVSIIKGHPYHRA